MKEDIYMRGSTSTSASSNKPHVKNEIDILNMSIIELEAACGVLANKISGVLRQDQEKIAEELPRVDKYVVDVASQIRSERYRIQDLSVALNKLINKIEI